MASTIASDMAKAVSALGDGFKSFSSSTITEAVWNGDAAENAKTQITSKIDPKIEEVTTKLNNLQEALNILEAAKVTKGNIEEYEKALANLDPKSDGYFKNKVSFNLEKLKLQKEYDGYIRQIKKLCSN